MILIFCRLRAANSARLFWHAATINKGFRDGDILDRTDISAIMRKERVLPQAVGPNEVKLRFHRNRHREGGGFFFEGEVQFGWLSAAAAHWP